MVDVFCIHLYTLYTTSADFVMRWGPVSDLDEAYAFPVKGEAAGTRIARAPWAAIPLQLWDGRKDNQKR